MVNKVDVICLITGGWPWLGVPIIEDLLPKGKPDLLKLYLNMHHY